MPIDDLNTFKPERHPDVYNGVWDDHVGMTEAEFDAYIFEDDNWAPNTAMLDRYDLSLGFVPGNVLWVCCAAYKLRRLGNDEERAAIAHRLRVLDEQSSATDRGLTHGRI
jgi:hypothetical protein